MQLTSPQQKARTTTPPCYPAFVSCDVAWRGTRASNSCRLDPGVDKGRNADVDVRKVVVAVVVVKRLPLLVGRKARQGDTWPAI